MSEIGKAISENLPEAIDTLISEAQKSKSAHEDILDWLHKSMRWNYQSDAPQQINDEDSIDKVTFKLFAQYVAGSDQLVASLEEYSRRALRVPQFKQNLGQTFHAALAIAGPEFSVSAD
jgi:hypothetical protein